MKKRNRGLSGGEMVAAVASTRLAGEDFQVGLNRRWADTASWGLAPVTTPVSTTVAGFAKRFGKDELRGSEAAIGAVNTIVVSLLPLVRRTTYLKGATIEGDVTDIEA